MENVYNVNNMNLESKKEFINNIAKNNTEIENIFFSFKIGCDTPFYDKDCIEEGDFSWSCKELGYTVFINPSDLYDESMNSKTLVFLDEE